MIFLSNPNPSISIAPQGGYLDRYYKLLNSYNGNPVIVPVHVTNTNGYSEYFISKADGVVEIEIESNNIENGLPGATDVFSIVQIGNTPLTTPILFTCEVKELNYENKVYTNDSPAFSVSYPKHYKTTKPALNEVFLVKNSMGSTPQISVYVENQPMNIQLEEIGQQYLLKLVEKYSTKAKLVYSTQAALKDGSPAIETLFDRVIYEHWPFKTLVLSTYRDDKLIYVATTSFTHPEALKEYLYSLRFH